MASINLQGLSQSLQKKFKRLGIEATRKRAQVHKALYSSIAKTWRAEVRAKLLKPASARGLKGRSINPHNSLRYNQGFPMSVTGALANSVWQRVTIRDSADGSIITISKGFSPLDKDGYDYGNILNAGGKNNRNLVLKDFKERAYDILDKYIANIARRKGY